MRTAYCGKLRLNHVNETVRLCGWVQNIRHFKKIIFINMRDCNGIVQIIIDNRELQLFEKAKTLRNEFCIQITGIVQEKNAKNISIQNGDIEVLVSELIIINSSNPLPLDQTKKNKKNVSLKYRYLELRNSNIINNLKIRNDVINFIHNFLYKNNFLYIETPILTQSTPEGARDYLVPSRIHKKKFYALPQSPQLFKQLLMIAGIDRYYQIAKCFRDEDLRSDRQPEFTQIDLELSFVNAIQVQNIIELMICNLWMKIKNINLPKFPKITFKESIKLYGTDKPDLRNPIMMTNIKTLFSSTIYHEFTPFMKDENSRIVAINIPDGNNLSDIEIQKYQIETEQYHNSIFLCIKNNQLQFINKNFKHSIKKIFTLNVVQEIIKKTCSKKNHVIFIIANKTNIIHEVFNKIKKSIGTLLKIIQNNVYKPIWITEFPMFYEEIDGTLSCMHHPFSAPLNITIEELRSMPKKTISNSYDLVINGYELGGGSVRIHDPVMQKTVLDIISINKPEEQRSKFDFFINALGYGTPVHAGIALGLDRLIMLLTNNHDIKDVIAFPKTTTASCLMTNAPNKINEQTLNELFIQYNKEN
ncbi:Aspartate--tRNA ligase [Buchnera aphidicola (Eriosoma grossulariae)]|uniref:aspartate--tRNA ligase n=1 Tax=Buchnera aphidicola TaxID=9 RepID=UPI003463CDFE